MADAALKESNSSSSGLSVDECEEAEEVSLLCNGPDTTLFTYSYILPSEK